MLHTQQLEVLKKTLLLEKLSGRGVERIVGLDFETYYDQDYTLKKMSTTEYIRHRKFKAQSVALRVHDQSEVKSYAAPDISDALGSIDWSTSAVLCHHTHFDGLILSHHYGAIPAFYLCSLSMARPLHSSVIRNDLNSVAEYYEVGNKLPDILSTMKGKLDLSDEELHDLLRYNEVDVDIMWEVFLKMLPLVPFRELELIHHTIRAYADPVLTVNKQLVRRLHKEEIERREKLVLATGLTKEILRSRNGFAAELEAVGVKPPTKISRTTDKKTFAFAKNDLEFQALGRHPDERVRNLYEARLVCASSIAATRAKRLLDHSKNGRLPIYLKYGGAHTLRWSGGDKMNPQNFPRDSEMRSAIKAPPGHSLIVFDSGQIEARVNAWLAKQDDLVKQFREKDAGDESQDPYKVMACKLFDIPYEKVTKLERFVGKTCILGLGYMMGADKLHYTLISGSQGPPIDCSIEDCQGWVDVYREANDKIVAQWAHFEKMLLVMMGKAEEQVYGPITFKKGGFLSANGMTMRYPSLKALKSIDTKWSKTKVYKDWVYGPNEINLYGGKITENIVQNLARHVVAEQILRVSDDYRLVLQVHDEGVWCVPKKQAQVAFKAIEESFRTPPDWAKDLPVIGEGEISPYYVKP